MAWQPDVVCDNTHAQQITVHLRSTHPRKLAHVTNIFFPIFTAEKHDPATAIIAIFIFETIATHTHTHTHTHIENNNSRRLRTSTGRRGYRIERTGYRVRVETHQKFSREYIIIIIS